MSTQKKLALLPFLLAVPAVLFANVAFAEDAYEIAYPPYIKSVYQKEDFAAQCVVVYEQAKRNAVDESNERRAELRVDLWEQELETLVEKKKRRKKLVKNERKSYSSNDLLSAIKNAKKSMQCDFPTEDLRNIG